MILVVDCGLSALKLTLADRDGRVVQVEREPYPTRFAGAHAEQRPEAWWTALHSACGRIERRREVSIVVPTGHMHALVLVDGAGQPLLPCLTLHDRRGAALLEGLDGASFRAETGQFLDASLPIAKLIWLAATDPALLARAATLLAPKDYIGLRLTGETVTDPIDASGTGLYELAAGRWSERLSSLASISGSLLPPVGACTDLRGPLLADVARALGLPDSAQVVVGAGDDIELLGATGYRPGDAVEHVGTSGVILRVPRAAAPMPSLELQPTALAGVASASASISNCGAVLGWVESTLGVALGEALARPARDDDPIALPSLLAERHVDPSADSGALVANLRIQHDRVDIARALVTGVALSLARLLRLVERESGAVETLIVSGGSSSTAWPRLRAAAYDRPITMLDVDPTARGAIALGLVAGGDAGTLGEAEARSPAASRSFEPVPDLVRVMRAQAERSERYRESALAYPSPAIA